MKALANAIVTSAAFLELWGADVVEPDPDIRAMEDIASALQQASAEECAALEAVLYERLEDANHSGSGETQVPAISFYSEFMEWAGSKEEPL